MTSAELVLFIFGPWLFYCKLQIFIQSTFCTFVSSKNMCKRRRSNRIQKLIWFFCFDEYKETFLTFLYLILFHPDYTDGTTSCVVLAFLSNTAALVAMSLSVLRGTFQGKVKFLRMIVVGTLALSSKNHIALLKLYYHSYLYMCSGCEQSYPEGSRPGSCYRASPVNRSGLFAHVRNLSGDLLHPKVVDLAPPYSQCYGHAIRYTNTSKLITYRYGAR